MVDRPFSPGEEPLGAIRTDQPAIVLGGRPFKGVDRDEVLGRLGMTLSEAGAVETRVHGYGVYGNTAGAWAQVGMQVPEGVSWRVKGIGAYIQSAGTFVPVLTATSVVAGVWHHSLPPLAPSTIAGIPIHGAGALSWDSLLIAGPGASALYHGDLLMKENDVIWAGANEAAGDILMLYVSYIERSGDGVPPA